MLFRVCHMYGIAHYESLLESHEQTFRMQVLPDLVLYYRDALMDNAFWVSGWNPIPRGVISEMVDQVRNRVLSFALDIENENPDAGEAVPGSDPPVDRDRVAQIFQTTIYGGSNVVASGSGNVIRDFENIGGGDRDQLIESMRELGIPEEDLGALGEALDEDASDPEQDGPLGRRTQEWVAAINRRCASGAIQLANGVTGSVLGTMVMQYAGLV